MAKKTTKVTETVTEEPVPPPEPAPAPIVKDEEEPVLPKEEPKKEEKLTKDEQKKLETEMVITPHADGAVDSDDDISYIKQVLAKQMIDSLDVDTLKKFIVECEGKSLKQKADWIAKNKPVPAPDPSNGLPKGPAGGKPLGPYDPGFKHVFVDNRPKR